MKIDSLSAFGSVRGAAEDVQIAVTSSLAVALTFESGDVLGYFRSTGASGPGKSAGTFWVTFPVAAHSVPRWKVPMNATLRH